MNETPNSDHGRPTHNPHEGIQTEFDIWSWDNWAGRDSDSEEWQLSAERLAQAADRLLEPGEARAFSVAGQRQQNLGGLADPFDLSYVWGMLAGMCLEATLKGIVAVQRNGLISPEVIRPEDGPLPVAFQRHWLRRMAEHIGVPLDDADRTLLDRLEACVRWKGRYPIPNREDEYQRPDPEEFQPADATRFQELRSRFEAQSRDEIIPYFMAKSERQAREAAAQATREAARVSAEEATGGNPEVM